MLPLRKQPPTYQKHPHTHTSMVLSIIIIWIQTDITMLLLSQLNLLAYHPHPDLQTCRVTLQYVNQVTPSVKPAAATNKTGPESADNSSVCRTSKPHMTRQPVVHMRGFSDCQSTWSNISSSSHLNITEQIR